MEVMRSESVRLELTDASQVAEVRRAVQALAVQYELPAAQQATAALIATEAATNVVKHAGHGELVVQVLVSGQEAALELLAIDSGPGMADVARCLEDGYSTAGTPGNGLGAIRRQARSFDLWSAPGQGTVLLARVGGGNRADHLPLTVSGVCLPKPGETACGDSWGVIEHDGRALLMVADGLGHGPQAAEASRAAVATLESDASLGPEGVIQAAHARLRALRGAAVAVAEINPAAQRLAFVGVGNVAGLILGPERHALTSHNGTVGHQMRKVQRFEYRWPGEALLVLSSDGIATGWELSRYAGLINRDPAVIAGVIYRDFRRLRDDATVVVLRGSSR